MKLVTLSLILWTILFMSSCGSSDHKTEPHLSNLTSTNIQHLEENKISIATLDRFEIILDTQATQLSHIFDAHKMILKILGKDMPLKVEKELDVELKILDIIYQNHIQLNKTIKVVRVHLQGGSITADQANKMISGLDTVYMQVNNKLTEPDIQSSRQYFKSYLKELTDLFISNDPKNIYAYNDIKTQLDPNNLDQQITEQRTILSGLKVIMNVVK